MIKGFSVPYSQNNIRIDFLGISYRSQGTFSFKYRLNGLDRQWIKTSSKASFARYPSLPAGKYNFEVKSINEDGVESKDAAKVEFEILKPFWQKWWF